jgi:hypothetical protein
MKTLLESTFGANWRTTVTGIGTAVFSALTVLAALPYTLGEVATVIPSEWKEKVVVISATAAFILKVWNAMASKDARVGGTGAPLDPHRVDDGHVSPHIVR